MKIFLDFHHAGLFKGLVGLFCGRLNHEIYSANLLPQDSAELWGLDLNSGIWNVQHVNFWEGVGKYPNQDKWSEHKIITYDEFMSTQFDLIIITRPESQNIIDKLLKRYPLKKPKLACNSGNEIFYFDYDTYKNLISHSYMTYKAAPKNINSILFNLEISSLFMIDFVPIKKEHLKHINCFINCLDSMSFNFNWNRDSFINSKCPHCCSIPTSKPYPNINIKDEWVLANKTYDDYSFNIYGHGNESIPGNKGFISESDLVNAYIKSSLTWHPKICEGYGLGLLQSLAMGRPALVPENFYKYRTAGKFLIPESTCFEVGWSAESIKDTINYVTSSLNIANEYAKRCWSVSKTLMDWDYEAKRVERWMENLL